jgi:hypothetical protein
MLVARQLLTNKSQLGYQILAYLVEHPDAQDTVEGIVEWWLLERQIKFQTARVKEVLCELVAKGLIIEQKGYGPKVRYIVNQSRFEEIKKLVNLMSR